MSAADWLVLVQGVATLSALLFLITVIIRDAIWSRKKLREARADLLAQQLRTAKDQGKAEAWAQIRAMYLLPAPPEEPGKTAGQ